MPEPELSLLFVRPLNRIGARYLVSESIASILYGEPRLTHDVDFVIFLRDSDITHLQQVFPAPEFYTPSSEAIAAEIARPTKGQFNVIHSDTGFKADFYTAGRDGLNAWAFRNSRTMEYRGEPMVVAPPEYVILRKLEYFREAVRTNICATSAPCWPFRAISWTAPHCRNGFKGSTWKPNGGGWRNKTLVHRCYWQSACRKDVLRYNVDRLWRKTSRQIKPHEPRAFRLRRVFARNDFGRRRRKESPFKQWKE